MVTYTTNRRSGPELPERQRSASRACANNSPSGGGTPWHCSAPQQQLQERRGIRTLGGTASIPVHRWRLARHTAHRKREGKCPGRGKVMQAASIHPPMAIGRGRVAGEKLLRWRRNNRLFYAHNNTARSTTKALGITGQFCHPETSDDHNVLTSTPEAGRT